MNRELLEKLTNAQAVPGYEGEVRDILKEEFTSLNLELDRDNIGSIIGRKQGNGPKLMLAGHMDEVGFIVKSIDDEGFVRFETAGGWWSQVMLAKTVTIKTRSGKKIDGIIGSTPPHVLSVEDRKKPVEITDMYIDLGASNKQQVLDAGIEIGNMIAPKFEFNEMLDDNFLAGKAFDNRVGCYIITEVMRNLANEEVACDIYAVGTVQEEIGLRGAKTSANKINPDVAIAIDTGIAGDTPGIDKNKASSKLGDGPLITVMDAGTLSHVGLRNYIFDLADELGFKYQPDFLKGGATDAGNMHLAHDGALAITISLATRYLHSQSSVIHKDDLETAVKIITEFARRLNDVELGKIINE